MIKMSKALASAMTNFKLQITNNFKVLNSKFKSFDIWHLAFGIYLVFGAWSLVFIQPVLALDASASAEASTSADVTDKIKLIKEEVASKAAKLKVEVNQKMQNKVFVGSVTRVASDKIILNTRTGTYSIVINEYTLYGSDDPKFKKYSFKNVEEGDYIAALGDVDDKNIMTAKKIQLQVTTKVSPLVQFWGRVQSINGGGLQILKNDNSIQKVITTLKTSYQQGINEATFADIKQNLYIAGVGKKTADQLVADFIYITPTGSIKPEKKPASPAASIKATATPSGNIKKK